MTPWRRLRLFLRDYFEEFPIAWSIARYRDCERNDGHRWSRIEDDRLMGPSHTCRRCGVSEAVEQTGVTSTGSATAWNLFPSNTSSEVDAPSEKTS